MCGINGFVSDNYTQEEKVSFIRKMNSTLAHRGPDNDGVWQGEKVCLGHRRLSIIDLSAESNQPFFSQDNRYVIIYNGELYNYRELKLELQRSGQGKNEVPYFFRTNSDTEVVLAAFMRWGKKCLDLFNGMFAFAIYDIQQEKLLLARDRMGVKPLYYYYGEECFVFSSEVRPIIHAGIKSFSLNKEVLAEYAMYQTVFAPNTILKGIKMLLPGHLIEFEKGKANIQKYYTIHKINRESEQLNYSQTCTQVNELLTLSVQRRMVADVPFGAFLSGGIDSSAIVGLMSKVSSERVQTFNISFDESEFSEAKYARLIAKKFNTVHHEIKLSPADFLKQVPEALAAIDHPSGDGPNTYIVSKATKNAGITMALSGIGGDELFAGYDVFKRMMDLKKKSWLNAVPLLARKSVAYAIKLKQNSVGGNKIQELLGQTHINFNSSYPLNRSLFTLHELNKLLGQAKPFSTINSIVLKVPQIKDHLLSAVSISEINTYLQNTLLRDADQMSMAVALEVREPFLDYKLIEFVLGIDDEKKFPHSPKKLLTDSLGDLLPEEVINRPKMGFTLPWQDWLKQDLKSFCEENIEGLEEKNIFIRGSLRLLWQRFLLNDKLVSWSRVWHFVVLNNWLDENGVKN
jgi:asparagine synthase (glutamine-hydrolysing)